MKKFDKAIKQILESLDDQALKNVLLDIGSNSQRRDDHFTLKEGLIKSYDHVKILQKIKDTYLDDILGMGTFPYRPMKSLLNIFVKDDGESPKSFYVKGFLFEEEKLKELERLANLYGYIIARKVQNDLTLIFEPKFPKKFKGKISKFNTKKFFHVTKKENLEKIQKYGLSPKISQTAFNHPSDRIYLFMTKRGSEKQMIDNMKATLGHSKGLPNPSQMVALEIKNNKESNYYIDTMGSQIHSDIHSIFTQSNIRPENIGVVK